MTLIRFCLIVIQSVFLGICAWAQAAPDCLRCKSDSVILDSRQQGIIDAVLSTLKPDFDIPEDTPLITSFEDGGAIGVQVLLTDEIGFHAQSSDIRNKNYHRVVSSTYADRLQRELGILWKIYPGVDFVTGFRAEFYDSTGNYTGPALRVPVPVTKDEHGLSRDYGIENSGIFFRIVLHPVPETEKNRKIKTRAEFEK